MGRRRQVCTGLCTDSQCAAIQKRIKMLRLWTFSLGLLLALSIGSVWSRAGAAITSGKAAPEIAGQNWLNSKPLTIAELKGRVLLVEFWTYG